jgi:hypothetical protein
MRVKTREEKEKQRKEKRRGLSIKAPLGEPRDVPFLGALACVTLQPHIWVDDVHRCTRYISGDNIHEKEQENDILKCK